MRNSKEERWGRRGEGEGVRDGGGREGVRVGGGRGG